MLTNIFAHIMMEQINCTPVLSIRLCLSVL